MAEVFRYYVLEVSSDPSQLGPLTGKYTIVLKSDAKQKMAKTREFSVN